MAVNIDITRKKKIKAIEFNHFVSFTFLFAQGKVHLVLNTIVRIKMNFTLNFKRNDRRHTQSLKHFARHFHSDTHKAKCKFVPNKNK